MGRHSSKRSSASSTASASSGRSVWSNFSTGGFTDIREIDCEVIFKPVPSNPSGVTDFCLWTVGHNPGRHRHQLVRTDIRTYTGMDSVGRIHQWRELDSYFVSGGQKSKKNHAGGRPDRKTPPTRMPRPTQARFPGPQPGSRPPPVPPQGIPPTPGVYGQPPAGFHQPGVQVVDEEYSSDGSSDWSGDDVIDVEPTPYAQPPPHNFPPGPRGPGRAFPGPPPPPPQGGLPGGAPFIKL